MNYYKQIKLGSFKKGGLEWEFGKYDITGAYYIKCIDYPGVSQTIWMADEEEALSSANGFIDKFIESHR